MINNQNDVLKCLLLQITNFLDFLVCTLFLIAALLYSSVVGI